MCALNEKFGAEESVLSWLAKSGLAKGTNIMYANIINGIL